MAPKMKQFDRPKTRRGKKYQESRASKVVENDKKALMVRGGKTSPTVTTAMTQIYALKKPLAMQLKE